jgi:hypothetical protein
VPSAFISYAHEDETFVLALVEFLQKDALDIRYDQIVLEIGDSLLQRIASEIQDGDFLIAIVTPDSVESEWCQKEVAMAATQGINEHRPKVLPVRFRGATMPAMLGDIYWADADRDSVETVARRLAAAMRARTDADLVQAAQDVQATGGSPAHAEVAGDVLVGHVDAVAEQAWSVLDLWALVEQGRGNLQDLEGRQRRLRYGLDVLPDRVRAGLPGVEELSTSRDDRVLLDRERREGVEADLRAEARSVRTQVAQGLPVTRRWQIGFGPRGVSSERDAEAYVWEVRRGEERRRVVVYISGVVVASTDDALPREVVNAKRTLGRSVVSSLLGLDDPPAEVIALTTGISFNLP